MAERVPVETRITSRVAVDPISGCWNWQGARTADGYGSVRIDGAALYTHRVMYAIHVGELRSGMHVDHLCHNRACCNPSHLEQVTPRENVRRGESAVLDIEAVAAIKARLVAGEAATVIARDFAVSPRAISRIRDGATWQGIAAPAA